MGEGRRRRRGEGEGEGGGGGGGGGEEEEGRGGEEPRPGPEGRSQAAQWEGLRAGMPPPAGGAAAVGGEPWANTGLFGNRSGVVYLELFCDQLSSVTWTIPPHAP